MAMLNNRKFCPRCGSQVSVADTYCTRCGYSFRRGGGRRTSFRSIIIVIIVLLIFWIIMRTVTKQPIIPPTLVDLFKNMTSNKTG